jgi:hypothetical protein
MSNDRWTDFPARPPGIAEWEELLLRFELGTRAFRVHLEDVDWESDEALAALRGLVERERRTAALLRAMMDGLAQEPEPSDAPLAGSARALYDEFERLRARAFAVVQRRGLEVWDWSIRLHDGAEVTTFQFLSHALREDARLLAGLRRLPQPARDRC